MEKRMKSRERLLGIAAVFRKRGQPIPIDILAEAERQGLMLEDLEEPKQRGDNCPEGDNHNG